MPPSRIIVALPEPSIRLTGPELSRVTNSNFVRLDIF